MPTEPAQPAYLTGRPGTCGWLCAELWDHVWPWRRGVEWTDVEVVCENGGPPQVLVTGATAELMAARGAAAVLLTTAHSRTFATATSIAVGVSAGRTTGTAEREL